MKAVYIVDGDNHVLNGLNGVESLTENETVMIFHQKGLNLNRITQKLRGSHADIQFIESVKSGKNSIDFQIVAELGMMAAKKQLDEAYIISCDKGYIPAIQSIKSRYPQAFKKLELCSSIWETFNNKPTGLLTVDTKEGLHNVLVTEYGATSGNIIYSNIKAIFKQSEQENPLDIITKPRQITKSFWDTFRR